MKRDGRSTLVMVPPLGFVERAVARGLAMVQAEEALLAVEHDACAFNDNPDTIPADRPVHRGKRRRHDSGVIDLLGLTGGDRPSSSKSG